MEWPELLATAFGIAYLVLLMRENMWCWVAGNISVAIISYSCVRAHLFADAALQLIYFALGVYGFVLWRRSNSNRGRQVTGDVGQHEQRRIRHTKLIEWLWLALAFTLGWLAVFGLVSQVRGAALAQVDSLLFAASIVATIMQARKLLENWILWIPINISYAYVYHLRNLEAYVYLSILYAAMSALGWMQWRKLYRVT